MPAAARDTRYRVDIPAGPLAATLAALSQATGLSFGLNGTLPPFRTAPLHGAMTANEALSRLLAGSGFRAVQVGTLTFRIEPSPPTPKPVTAPAMASEAPPAPDIIVTGEKRRQPLGDVPASLAVVTFPANTPGGVLSGSRDIALSVEGLALTNLGPGRNREFIRGVADSPFDGPSQSTVAVQLDDARITYDAPDPDLRLVDMNRVEILKGPQGPLYGSGALGGIYHLITNKPEMDKIDGSAKLLSEAVQHGGPGIGGEAVLNLPLVTDRLALRAVGYALRGGGWIDDIGRKSDANISTIYGGRLALRWRPSPDWTVDLTGILQYLNVADSQYVTSSDTLKRSVGFAEPADNDFRAITGTIEGRIGSLNLVSASSYVDHDVGYTLDATDAAAQFGLIGQTKFRDDRTYTIINQELRLSPPSGRWLIGASFLQAHSHSTAIMSDSAGTRLPIETLDRKVFEYALFGEVTVPIAGRLSATAGGRLYRTTTEDEALERSAGNADRVSKTAFSPSLSLAWRLPRDSIVYLRYARALRPGGLAGSGDPAIPQRFDSDELGSLDLGIRHQPTGARLTYSASLFYTVWDHIQSDYLLPNGLISTRNAGRGRIIGGEASFEWRFLPGYRLAAGMNLQNARLTHSENGLELTGRRLPVTPDMTARLIISHDFHIGLWAASVSAQGNYIGSARLSFDQSLDRKMGHYALLSAGASMTRRGVTIAARIDNLLDIKGDSFSFGNPFSILAEHQFTPLRPRTLTFSIAHSF